MYDSDKFQLVFLLSINCYEPKNFIIKEVIYEGYDEEYYQEYDEEFKNIFKNLNYDDKIDSKIALNMLKIFSLILIPLNDTRFLNDSKFCLELVKYYPSNI